MSDRPDVVGDPGLEREEFETIHKFTGLMFEKLKANRHKGSWKGADVGALLVRLEQEVDELKVSLFNAEVLGGSTRRREVAKEAADVANFAMFIADIVGGLE